MQHDRLQHEKSIDEISKCCTCNIQKSLLQHHEVHIATSQNVYCNIIRYLLQHDHLMLPYYSLSSFTTFPKLPAMAAARSSSGGWRGIPGHHLCDFTVIWGWFRLGLVRNSQADILETWAFFLRSFRLGCCSAHSWTARLVSPVVNSPAGCFISSCFLVIPFF